MSRDAAVQTGGAALGYEEVRSLLLQRFPFLMVDRVLDYVPGNWVRTIKNITGNELHFLGHFPDRAVMPGVLIVEAMAQTVGLLIMLGSATEPARAPRFGYLASANVSFHQPVTPGDQLEIEAKLVRHLSRFVIAKVVAFAGKVAARGEIVIGLDQE
jgi:3-hydroxyacyl-[acyl-carrier-protein] dehydratase